MTFLKEVIIIEENYKKTEAVLYDYKNLKAEIKNIDIEIEELKQNYRGCGSISYDEKSSPTYKFNSSIENEIVTREEQIKYLENIKNSKQRLIDKIDNALNTLDERSHKIIQLRYFNKQSNKQLAINLNLTEQRVSEIKTEIVNSLMKLIFIKY